MPIMCFRIDILVLVDALRRTVVNTYTKQHHSFKQLMSL